MCSIRKWSLPATPCIHRSSRCGCVSFSGCCSARLWCRRDNADDELRNRCPRSRCGLCKPCDADRFRRDNRECKRTGLSRLGLGRRDRVRSGSWCKDHLCNSTFNDAIELHNLSENLQIILTDSVPSTNPCSAWYFEAMSRARSFSRFKSCSWKIQFHNIAQTSRNPKAHDFIRLQKPQNLLVLIQVFVINVIGNFKIICKHSSNEHQRCKEKQEIVPLHYDWRL